MARKISLIGRTLGGGRYELRELFGKGSFAEVYRARQITLQRDVAIKILSEHASADEELVKRFHREAETIARFDHPHIIKIFDHGQEDELHYYVMNFLPRTLRSLLPPGKPLPLEVILQIARQIAAALAYAQSTVKNFVHRDLKPENVMLDQSHHAILSDFGLVRGEQITRLTQGNVVMGTPVYMSPEQIRGAAVDARADLYALGILLYECAAGTTPFKGEIMAVCHQHVNEAPPSPRHLNPGLPGEIEALILKLLEKEPTRRLQSAADLLAELEALPMHLRQPQVNIYSQPTIPFSPRREPSSFHAPGTRTSSPKNENGQTEQETAATPPRRNSMLATYLFVGASAVTFVLAMAYYFLTEGSPTDSAQRPALDTTSATTLKKNLESALGKDIKPAWGVLMISSQPPGAVISLNGHPQGRVSPARFDSLATGAYEIQLDHSDYQAWQATIQIDSAETEEVWAELLPPAVPKKFQKLPAASVTTAAEVPFLIVSEPPSEIIVDGVPQGRPLDGRVAMRTKPGKHRVQFRLEAYPHVTREVIVNAGADNRLEFKWFGSIRVQAFDDKGDPVFGAVFLDSMGTGQLSDGSEWPVPVGEYAVIVKKTGYVMRDPPPKIIVRGGDQPKVPPIVLQRR
ncbi:MAG: serine/threonine-protein kinase [bacterium]